MTSSGSIVPQLLSSTLSIILAVLAVAVVVRAIRDLIIGRGREGLFGRALRMFTDPIVRPVHAVAPRIVPASVVYLFALCWLTGARMLWAIVAAALGLRTGFGI